ncbi:MAG: acyltransferase domain-containing protein, partial [Thermoleophilia bacterium]
DLDDPAAALAAFAAALPAAATTLLHPADAQHALEVFDGPGKPVPFVPVLDAEVRRWFMADGLWQAQDDRLDADGVFIISGPASVGGIAQADEPVADLLRRFEAAAIDRLASAGAPVAERDRLADPGPVPEPLASAVAGRHGPVAALCASASVVEMHADGPRTRPNPLWRLVLPGDEVDAAVDDTGRLIHLTSVPRGSAQERVVVEADGRDVVVTAWVASLDPPAERFVIRGRPIEGGSGAFAEVEGGEAQGAFARRALTGGAPLEVTDPAAGVAAPWALDPAMVAGYRAATGAEHAGVPLDLALSLAWPAVAGLLGVPEVAYRLPELVHSRHRVTPGPAWPPRPGETGEARAHLAALDDPGDAPTRMTCEAVVAGPRGVVATLEAELMILGADGVTAAERSLRRVVDRTIAPGPAERALLLEQPWVRRDGEVPDGGPLRVHAEVTMERPRGGAARWRAAGTIAAGGAAVATIHLDATGDHAEHPVLAALDLAAGPPAPVAPRPRRELARDEDAAPVSMAPFARVGGDHNPLHRSVLVARLAGLEAPIAHGAWTAARAGALVADRLCDGDPSAIRDWGVRFTAPVPLGAPLDLEAERAGVREGRRVVDVRVRAGDAVVATARAEIAPPRTVLVFPGQGVQRPGLGADGRGRSRAARAAWDEADAAARERLGFSLIEAVEHNPPVLRTSGGEVLAHPAGVLYRTEVTQPALIAHASALLAELREAGVLGVPDAAAGHSVGEVSALLALRVIGLADAVELVNLRGRAMQDRVPRDAQGASPYRLAVVDPSAAGTDAAGMEAAVAALAAELGEPLEVVNRNATGRQYAVAGTARGIAALAARLRPRGGRPAVRELRGIDVPFHSSVLEPAVAGYRTAVARLVGPVDHGLLVGRWVPNLVGRPFALDDAFAEEVRARAGSALGPLGDDPDDRARSLLVALLARQIASPVLWTDTWRAIVAPRAAGGLGARRVIEVGPAHAPVLTDLARGALAAASAAGPAPEVLHAEADRDRVLDADESLPPPEDEAPAAPAPVVPVPAAVAVAAAPAAVADRPVDAGDALRLVLALQARVRPDQLDESETIDDLFQGVSSRRNQVLIDLGREFGLSGGEGAQSGTIGDLVGTLRERGAAYRYPGPYLSDAIAGALTRALGGSGLTPAQARGHAASAWGLGPGLVEHVMAGLALATRPGPSARGGDLG